MFNRLKEMLVSVVKDKEGEVLQERMMEARIIKEKERPIPPTCTQSTPSVDVAMYFPLQQGDVFRSRNGKEYQVCKKTITGAIEHTSVTLVWVNKPAMVQEKDTNEQVRFTSLREMNYYLEQEIASIIEVKKATLYQKEQPLTLDEAHLLAIEENQKRERIKQFFTK